MPTLPSEYSNCKQIIRPDGTYDRETVEALDISDETLRSLYESMIHARVLDERGQLLQRRGDFDFWMRCTGLEASHVGPAAALTDQDWLTTAWRQYGAHIHRGRPIEDILLFFLRGYETWETDAIDEMDAFERRLPHPVAVGTHIPQAVGHQWGRKYQGTDEVGLVAFGDGGSSKGDFHAGLNFAGVFDIPIVFLLLNNQWAISVPVERQTGAQTFAQRAEGYGFDGVLVDGNDVLATYLATREAVEHAREEHEPTLIESITYRRAPHSSSDDPSTYRDDDQDAWLERDPIDRFETFLADRGLWTETYGETIRERAKTRVDEAAEVALEIASEQSPATIFDNVYANPPAHVTEQRNRFVDALEREP